MRSAARPALLCGLTAALWAAASLPFHAREFHVAAAGNDAADGSSAKPLRTIQAAAERAQPGDTITVREGVYRERIDPPRGGESDAKRIIYQAAHNLFAGQVIANPEPDRQIPWQEEHGTKIAGMMDVKGGDNRIFNNLFIAPAGLDTYGKSVRSNRLAGNVFLKGAKPSPHEKSPSVFSDFDPALNLREEQGTFVGQHPGPRCNDRHTFSESS